MKVPRLEWTVVGLGLVALVVVGLHLDDFTAPPRPSGGPEAPAWTARIQEPLPPSGSIYESRLAIHSPLEGFDAVLLSAREHECTDRCPKELRVIGGEPGRGMLERMLAALDPILRTLAASPGAPPELRDWLLDGEDQFREHERRSFDEEVRSPLRGLYIAMPRPEFGSTMSSLGLALYDTLDARFDDMNVGPRSVGRRLLIARVESPSPGGEGARFVSGAIEISHGSKCRKLRPFAGSDSAISSIYGNLWGHFGGVPKEVAGLVLTADGELRAYGSDLVTHPMHVDGQLRRALQSLLARP